MKENKKVRYFEAIHNIISTIFIIVSFYFMFQNLSSEILGEAIIWGIVTGILYRMSFNMIDMDFNVGSLFATVAIFVFPWSYIAFIYGLANIINYTINSFEQKTSSENKKGFFRHYFIVSNMIIVGAICGLIKIYFLGYGDVNLKTDFIMMIVICIIESAMGLITIYSDLKVQDKIDSMQTSVSKHLKETYGIYIVYILLVILIAILYQDYSYIGLILASSCIFSLRIAFDKQAKAILIEEESYTDILTGVKNKKFYLDKLPEEFTTACAIFFIDFNGFKTINDTYGHDIGDEVIIHGAQILNNAVRTRDNVIRFGGDEFVLIIKDATKPICERIIQTIETQCKENLFKSGDLELQISMAIGVALCPEESQLKEELSVIADEKMYKAKQNKKNGLVVYKI